MRIDLPYGAGTTPIEVPDGNLDVVVEPDWPAVLARPEAAVTDALEKPVAGPPLAAVLAQQMGSRRRAADPHIKTNGWSDFHVVVAVSDLTRPCPNHDLLAPILSCVHQEGIPLECVTILIATGLHGPVTGRRTHALVGGDIVSACRIVNHFGHRPITLKRLGRTEAGTPVVLAREWVEANVRIATGVIEPHLMAGFSGGRKAVCPGLAGTETVCAWHAPKFLEDERTRPGVLEGNPEHEEALAVAAFAPPHFIVNATVDREANLTGVFAGEMRVAHEAGVAFLRQHVERPVEQPCDILVTTSGGRPLDATLYGAEKALLTGLPILKPGGTFLWAAALEGGLGSRDFAGLVRQHRTVEGFLAAITAEGASVVRDQWALENLSKATRHGGVLLWSDGLPWQTQEKALAGFVAPVRTLAEGLERAMQKQGPDARIVVSPHGPYTLPYVRQEAEK